MNETVFIGATNYKQGEKCTTSAQDKQTRVIMTGLWQTCKAVILINIPLLLLKCVRDMKLHLIDKIDNFSTTQRCANRVEIHESHSCQESFAKLLIQYDDPCLSYFTFFS